MADEWVVTEDEVIDFCTRCFVSLGVRQDHAHAMGKMMTTADKRGHYSHGLNRLKAYLDDWPLINRSKDAVPIIVKETVATALVDGNKLWGPVVGNFCMDLAMKKAKDVGIGWVSAKGCNHFGMAGLYSMRAMEQGLIGMAFTNATPNLVPTRSKEIQIQDRKKESIPAGWGMNRDCQPTTSAREVLDSLMVYPLGGTEETSGYKGYGLAMMVEIFCGIMSGSEFGPNIRHWTQDTAAPANLGQCFVAIDPSAFAPGFTNRMTELINHCRQLQPVDGETEVLVPGDQEKKHISLCETLGGLPYHDQQVVFADATAEQLGVKPLQRKKRSRD